MQHTGEQTLAETTRATQKHILRVRMRHSINVLRLVYIQIALSTFVYLQSNKIYPFFPNQYPLIYNLSKSLSCSSMQSYLILQLSQIPHQTHHCHQDEPAINRDSRQLSFHSVVIIFSQHPEGHQIHHSHVWMR